MENLYVGRVVSLPGWFICEYVP